MFEIKNPYLSSYSPFLIIFIMKLMMIWCYSFKNKTSGGPWDQKKRDLDLWSPKIYIAFHVWYSKSFSIILFPISNHIHHEGNDDFMLFFTIQDIWMTLKSKEGRFGSLKFIWHVTFEIQNPSLSSYSPFLIIFIMKIMMIWCFSFKYKTSGGPWSQKKEDLDPWNLYSMSRLKFKILL